MSYDEIDRSPIVTIGDVYAGCTYHQCNHSPNNCHSFLLTRDLAIPDYQRQYCWQTRNVKDFLEGIALWQKQKEKEYTYHAGTVILNRKRDTSSELWDIIDGQQRLTTLAIFAHEIKVGYPIPLLEKEGHLFKEEEIHAIIRARNAIKELIHNGIDIDLSQIVFSVVTLSNTPDDLAYTFFSNNNSTGKRLTDYDLLKTHHLRYLSTDKESEFFSKKWMAFEKSGYQDDLLQKMLFRLRKWNNKEFFSFESCGLDKYTVFNHYRSYDPWPSKLPCTQIAFRFNSKLSGGREFFVYSDYYNKKFRDYIQAPSIKALEKYLGWHSNGVICAGVKALAFLFYCKFGDLYLNEAVYLLVYHLSRLRNEYQVRTQYLSDIPIFQETTQILDQVTSEAQFFGFLGDFKKRYETTNMGAAAKRYWTDRNNLMKELSNASFAIEEIRDATKERNKQQ